MVNDANPGTFSDGATSLGNLAQVIVVFKYGDTLQCDGGVQFASLAKLLGSTVNGNSDIITGLGTHWCQINGLQIFCDVLMQKLTLATKVAFSIQSTKGTLSDWAMMTITAKITKMVCFNMLCVFCVCWNKVDKCALAKRERSNGEIEWLV